MQVPAPVVLVVLAELLAELVELAPTLELVVRLRLAAPGGLRALPGVVVQAASIRWEARVGLEEPAEVVAQIRPTHPPTAQAPVSMHLPIRRSRWRTSCRTLGLKMDSNTGIGGNPRAAWRAVLVQLSIARPNVYQLLHLAQDTPGIWVFSS